MIDDNLNITFNQRIHHILKNGVKCLGLGANLYEAKQLMENEVACNDRIITSEGTSTGSITGWITDNTKRKVKRTRIKKLS